MCLNLTFLYSFLYTTAQLMRIAPTMCQLCFFILLLYLDIEGKMSPLFNSNCLPKNELSTFCLINEPFYNCFVLFYSILIS